MPLQHRHRTLCLCCTMKLSMTGKCVQPAKGPWLGSQPAHQLREKCPMSLGLMQPREPAETMQRPQPCSMPHKPIANDQQASSQRRTAASKPLRAPCSVQHGRIDTNNVTYTWTYLHALTSWQQKSSAIYQRQCVPDEGSLCTIQVSSTVAEDSSTSQ